MASPLNNEDLFIIGNQSEKKTYKATYDTIQKKIQEDTDAVVIKSPTPPTELSNGEDLIEGTLWYRTGRISQELYIYESGSWQLIVSPHVKKIVAGDNITVTPKEGIGTVKIDGVPKTKPDDTEVENGDLWVDTSKCPPKLMVWTDCLPEGPEWIEIGPPDIVYLMKDTEGNVFVNGNVFITGVLHDFEELAGFTPTKKIRLDNYGNVYIPRDMYVGKTTEARTFLNVIPHSPVHEDANGDVSIEGSLIVLGEIYTLA